MFRTRGNEFYGSGVIKNTAAPNIDAIQSLIGERSVDKDPIRINPQIKVHKNLAPNYYKDYMNESIDNTNFEEREDYNLNEAAEFLEPQPNENLDFDGNGQPDYSYGSGTLGGKHAEDAEDAGELIHDGEEKIEEHSIKEAPKHEIIKEAVANKELMDEPKSNPMEVNKDVKLNTTDTRTNRQTLGMADGVVMGAGALAMALMVMGRNL